AASGCFLPPSLWDFPRSLPAKSWFLAVKTEQDKIENRKNLKRGKIFVSSGGRIYRPNHLMLGNLAHCVRVCTHKSPEAGYGTATSLVCCRCGDLHSGRVPWLESSQCRTAHSRGSIGIPRRSRDFLEPRICEQIAPGAISTCRGESAGKPDCG